MRTHGSIVFLAGDAAYKIKRAVRFPYMDFSTVDLRHRALERELDINRRHAPELYLELVPITQEDNGTLRLGGRGAVIEWALRMRRFEQDCMLGAVVEQTTLAAGLCDQLADAVFESHMRAERRNEPGADTRVAKIIGDIAQNLAHADITIPPLWCDRFRELAMQQLHRSGPCLRRRGAAGFVRWCHGDLHLNNIIVWNGTPVLFDALEFSEDLATIDTLYDLAFLLMDLDQWHHRLEANRILNRYLWRSGEELDIEALVALPLFLGLRSAIRGMVYLQRAQQTSGAEQNTSAETGRSYIERALRLLAPDDPTLIAIGGASGTGKTTLAASMAPDLAPSPGALHIRTGLERKSLFSTDETQRLPTGTDTLAPREQVYREVFDKTRIALAAGHSVVVDAAFLNAPERLEIERIAAQQRCQFRGIWLTAPLDTRLARVSARTHDASDADARVVQNQAVIDARDTGWIPVDAGGTPDQTYLTANTHLA
jgi:uncharacterized protein